MTSSRCRVPGCRRKIHARRLCQRHYDEHRKKPQPARKPGRRRAAAAPASPPAIPMAPPGVDMAGKMCCVPGCTNPHHAKGYCKSHYGQLRRRGSIEGLPEDAAGQGPVLSPEHRLLEIKKRHEILKKEIASIHKALESESSSDDG